jgi:hypothetical protein
MNTTRQQTVRLVVMVIPLIALLVWSWMRQR